MMVRTHNSNSWMLIAGTLLFSALMVLALVAFPQQSAHAAPKPKTVRCQETGGHLECGAEISVGDSVAVKETLGKDTCAYLVTVTDVIEVTAADGSLIFATVTGKVIIARGKNDVCLELGVVKGELTTFIYYPAPPKGGGKK